MLVPPGKGSHIGETRCVPHGVLGIGSGIFRQYVVSVLIHLISARLEGYAGKAGSGCRTARMRAVRLASSFSYTRTYTNLPVFQRYSKTFAKTHTLMLQTPQVHLVPLLSYSASLPGSTITTKRGLFHLIRR